MNMMEFSKEEITDLQEARALSRLALSAGSGKGARANSVSSGGGAGGTEPNEDDLKKKTSKGILGFFGRKGSSQQRREGLSNDNSGTNIQPSPAKPMMPIGRR